MNLNSTKSKKILNTSNQNPPHQKSIFRAFLHALIASNTTNQPHFPHLKNLQLSVLPFCCSPLRQLDMEKLRGMLETRGTWVLPQTCVRSDVFSSRFARQVCTYTLFCGTVGCFAGQLADSFVEGTELEGGHVANSLNALH